jgi:hypothetical protein
MEDYLELQQQRRRQELAELTSSSSTRHPTLEQQQPSDYDDKQTARATTYDNNNVVVAVKPQTQNEQTAVSEHKDTIIENMEKKIEQLQEEIKYLRPGSAAQHQQEEETFTALGCLELQNNDVPIKVTVNVKTKTIEFMEIDHEVIKNVTRMTYQEATNVNNSSSS